LSREALSTKFDVPNPDLLVGGVEPGRPVFIDRFSLGVAIQNLPFGPTIKLQPLTILPMGSCTSR
jgi:hypothetical protein